MQIKIHQFIPSPIAETFSGSSDVWLQDNKIMNRDFITSVISSSGKGKSSLLSAIYGLRKDYKGEIFIDEKNIKSFDLTNWSYLRKARISMVFQSLKLFPKLSALDNVLLKNSLSNHKSLSEIEHWFEKLGMSDIQNQTAGTLSFGQQQRVANIRALCQPYTTLLLDEPFSHLDTENAHTAWDIIIEESKKQQASIIIAGLSASSFFTPDTILNL